MVAWMVYLIGVGCAIAVAGSLAERGLRSLGQPLRWIWVCAMGATLALPIALGLVVRSGSLPGVGGIASATAVVAVQPPWNWIPTQLGSPGVDAVLFAAWFALTMVLLGNLRLAAWSLRRNERSWRTGSVAGRRVLMSQGFGPGVIGASRPRIVFPEWVSDATPSLRRLILMHEIEHIRARDTQLLLAGVVLLVVVPWCIPLWWQLHRLRRAIEMDCDARVLTATGDPRGYANALVTVAGQRTPGLLPVATFTPGREELQERIHLITAGRRKRSKLAGLGFLVTAAVLVGGVSRVPLPNPPNPNVEFKLEPAEWSTIAPTPGAMVILTVHGDDPEETLDSE